MSAIHFVLQGASGILGLARKFKIMDDDNSGNLDMPEFCKAMRECEIADMSKKAVEHLFRYFDSDDSGQLYSPLKISQ